MDMLMVLFLGVVGGALLYWGHRMKDDLLAVTFLIVGGVMAIIAILWAGDLFGFLAGLDAEKLRFIFRYAVLALAVSLFLIWIKFEEIASSLWSRFFK